MSRSSISVLALAGAILLVACGPADEDGGARDTSTGDTSSAADTASEPDMSTEDAADGGDELIEADVVPACRYPMHDELVQLGKIMPHLRWARAFRGDGSELAFDLEDFFCDDETYGDYTTLVFFVVAEWCPACNEVLSSFAESRYLDRVDAAGGLVVIVESETNSYAPATSEQGLASVGALLPNHSGIIVGDADTSPGPAPSNLLRSPLVGSYPSGFVVRRSDMRVITSVTEGEFFLDLEQVATDPDSFYQGPPTHTGPNCGSAEEEAAEATNDTAAGAALLEANPDAPTAGGICDDQPDFWRVEEPGRWLLQLSFDATVGDLDFYLWDAERDTYLLDAAGRRIGSAETGPGEVFQHCGPALVRVFGYNGSTAPYTLTLDSLGGSGCN